MRAWKIAGVVVASSLACPAFADDPPKPTAPASEKNPAVPAPGHSIHGEAFDDGPRQAAVLLPGMGKVDFHPSSSSPEARSFIDQGVAQLHSFYYLEAERSFRQAGRLDPDSSIACWGMAMANVNNPKRARGFLKEARTRASKGKPTRREQLYLDTLEAQYRAGGGLKDFVLGMEAIVQEFPDDLDARAWLAMATWQAGGLTSRQAVDSLLEAVEKAEPMHPGVHHYRIHLWDHAKVARAEKSAATYASTAPGIAHAWHMPGHTYTELKRYADAAYQQEGSARVDHAAMTTNRVMPFEIHNYAHNNQWLATSLGHVGRAGDAIAVARNLVEQARDPQKNNKTDGGSAQRSGRLRWSELLARYELWDDLIAADESGALDWSDLPDERREKAYALGLAFAAKGNAAKLLSQIEAIKTLNTPPANPAPNTPAPQPKGAAELAELEGHAKLIAEDVGAAFELFAKATRMRGESLARAHLKARNFGLAEATAKKAADASPGEFPPQAAYVEVLLAVGKDDKARSAFQAAESLIAGADAGLPVLARIGSKIAVWRRPGNPSESIKTGRADLATLGPLGWEPYPAEPIELADTEGATWSLASKRGRSQIVLFFLGGSCAHCMQQLKDFGKEFEAFKALGADVVAISSDDPESSRSLKHNADGVKFPMPILADPSLGRFHAYRSFDDFEGVPLHGAFLIDPAGKVRFQRISAEPFLEVDFLKGEAARLNTIRPEAGTRTAASSEE